MYTLDAIFDNILQSNGDVKKAHLDFEKMSRSPQFVHAIQIAATLAAKGAPREVISGASQIDQDTLTVLELCPPRPREYLVPVTFKTRGLVRVTANTIYDAIILAKDGIEEGTVEIESQMIIDDSKQVTDSMRTIRQINNIMTSEPSSLNHRSYNYSIHSNVPIGDIPDDVLNGILDNIDNLFGRIDIDNDDNDGSDPDGDGKN